MQLPITLNQDFLQMLPQEPGVYRYYDKDGNLLYVGKAINLSRRVRSYFKKSTVLSPRISLMVSKIALIELTVTDNEAAALILENNLIKNQNPKYNIVFRDDKSYPYIRISHHEFPLIEYSRNKPGKDATYYGPYPNSHAVRETLDLLQKLFKLRTCKDSFFANRSRPCLLYQLNLCSAPCVGKINAKDYSASLKQAAQFLRGNYSGLIEQLSNEMYLAADKLDFEVAGSLRDKINLLKQLQEKQIISDSNIPLDADIMLVREYQKVHFIYLIIVRNGIYVGDRQFKITLSYSRSQITEAFLEQYYSESKGGLLIYSTESIADGFAKYFKENYNIQITDKVDQRIIDLMAMGELNLKAIIDNYRIRTIYIEGVLRLAELTHLCHIKRIECYDTSHNHGSSAIAAMVVYESNQINNNLYRKFNLPSDINGDDLKALEVVLIRRLTNKALPSPEIILVDGGYSQLNKAKNIINECGFHDKIRVIAISKGEDRRAELDTVIIDPDCKLNYHQEPQLFKLLQALRDEAHRFAITGHRKQQVAKMKYSRLEDIPGVGAQKRKALIAFFGSSYGVSTANIDELQQVKGIGQELATLIYGYFHNYAKSAPN